MKNSRRDFLKMSGLASASLFMPQFLKASTGLLSDANKPKVLVVIQFSGGNDGLNCIIPYGDDIYQKARPSIGYKKDAVIKLGDGIGMNTNLQGLADLYFNGDVVLINSVGYPNPNRSHFRSMDIWQTGSDENVYLQTGWIGRVLDATCNNDCAKPHFAVELDDSLSLALKGQQMSGFAVRDPSELKNVNKNPFIDSIAKQATAYDDEHHNVAYLHKLLADTAESTDYIYDQSVKYNSSAIYPATEFAKQLKTIAQLIIAESNTTVYYVSLSGFDTHAGQRNQQERQLRTYSDALKVFCADLKANGKFKDTMIMTFSEFGRRVEENAGNGTDHGTANNVYLISGGLKQGGMINDMPNLSNLVDGDLQHEVDFRSVYSTILNKWLNVKSEMILDNSYPMLDCL
jgi:uncharacterized protein (DUF1501 family)